MKIQYKCRMCEQLFYPCGGGKDSCSLGLQVAMHKNMAHSWEPKMGCPPDMHMLHHCKGGGLGVADLVGASKEPSVVEAAKELQAGIDRFEMRALEVAERKDGGL